MRIISNRIYIIELAGGCATLRADYVPLKDKMNAFRLTVDHDAMEAKLVVVKESPNSFASHLALDERLREAGVTEGIDDGAVGYAFKELAKAEEGAEFVIGRGTPAVNGKNGYIEFLVNVSGLSVYDGTAIQDSNQGKIDSIDYKNAIKIVSVPVGQRLAVVHPPSEGFNGRNMMGKLLPAHSGKTASLSVGEGVELSADGMTAFATSEGRPVFSNNKLVICQVFEVPSDVCFQTGNIRFDGYVHVHGDVLDEFSVEARNLEIDGVIGAANITCRGNLIVHGGVNGKNRALIVCQGTADVKYLNSARIEVLGNLNVAREINNSTVWCRATVKAGQIMGGEILALRGIEAKQLGTELGTPTVLCPGSNFEVRRIEANLRVFCQNIVKIIKDIGPHFGDHRYFRGLPPEKQEPIRKAYAIFCRLQHAHHKLTMERERLLNNAGNAPRSVVIALKELCEDVIIRTPRFRRMFIDSIRGPAAFIEDADHKTVKTVSCTHEAVTGTE